MKTYNLEITDKQVARFSIDWSNGKDKTRLVLTHPDGSIQLFAPEEEVYQARNQAFKEVLELPLLDDDLPYSEELTRFVKKLRASINKLMEVL